MRNREPWEMTIEEYAISKGARPAWVKAGYGETARSHRRIVQQALSKGELIPFKVLQDYPELIKNPPQIWVYVGDYIKFLTPGGREVYGDVSMVFDNGQISVIPDGGRSPIPVNQENVLGVERRGRLGERREHARLTQENPAEALEEVWLIYKEHADILDMDRHMAYKELQRRFPGMTLYDAMKMRTKIEDATGRRPLTEREKARRSQIEYEAEGIKKDRKTFK